MSLQSVRIEGVLDIVVADTPLSRVEIYSLVVSGMRELCEKLQGRSITNSSSYHVGMLKDNIVNQEEEDSGGIVAADDVLRLIIDENGSCQIDHRSGTLEPATNSSLERKGNRSAA